MKEDVLFNKYFAIVDNKYKAQAINFNDGFNYLILHTFEDFVYYKFFADKELIEQMQIG